MGTWKLEWPRGRIPLGTATGPEMPLMAELLTFLSTRTQDTGLVSSKSRGGIKNRAQSRASSRLTHRERAKRAVPGVPGSEQGSSSFPQALRGRRTSEDAEQRVSRVSRAEAHLGRTAAGGGSEARGAGVEAHRTAARVPQGEDMGKRQRPWPQREWLRMF